MARPRTFDEVAVVESAAKLFARRGFDAVSIDDLVGHLGVHRHSLYRTFGSKRGLYLRALRAARKQNLVEIAAADDPLRILCAAVVSEGIGSLDLLLMAAIEQGAADQEVAAEVTGAFAELDAVTAALGDGTLSTATLLGLRLRARAGDDVARIADEFTGRIQTDR
ncbi:transcriptional regulator, TetR family [Nocardia amikacinitolerans]|uniref:Transcriptional regulator, TetR family n=1 Tax=Nocardia amikacinitolerans TaxID=756689 RepID=A0A285L1Y9_9NOCA|nr:helix-turn-helix domain-containing protein [Nocardia amikacinitolerans]MCP2279520.1 transcriptional regulator, TetR family [Nocardia amikacinitolerans]MCP2296684.1 transcriptional regulator, TetR family [Nocardia amikacinitolerans]SNY78905.1 transcriptional regulator, TetR family [Nocardia amikacinitolerans]